MSVESKRLADVMRAEMDEQDLSESQCGRWIDILAKRDDGTFYSVGRVGVSLFFTDPEAGWKAVSAVKFARRRQ